MKVPPQYLEARSRLSDEVSFGCGGILLFKPSEIQKGQTGYSVDSEGASLCAGEDGAWRESWLVIGYETACGDPLFLETLDRALPVFTAFSGEGTWTPRKISPDIQAFASSLLEFQKVAKGRSNPLERDANDLPDVERQQFLEHIAELNGTEIDIDFWSALLEL